MSLPAAPVVRESVYNGLVAATNEHVIIHEAVRPFVEIRDFMELIEEENKNAAIVSPISFTVILIPSFIKLFHYLQFCVFNEASEQVFVFLQ